MKLSKLQELYGLLDKRAVLQHFVDSEPGKLYVGEDGVENKIYVHKELDMKLRVLLSVQIEKIEEAMREAGIDMDNKEEPDGPSESGDAGEDGEVIETTVKETAPDEEDSTG